jgi:Raf kinase inhibitor-like YbhB/YbcL family protein
MTVTTKLHLTSSAFEDGGVIPARYTCDGENVSPPLSWEAGPPGTAAWVLIAEDPDARSWVHWLIVNLPAGVTSLEEGVSGGLPGGAIEGETDFGPARYGGPCPSSGEHRYVFSLYALSEPLVPGAQLTATGVRADMFGKVLAGGGLTGRYTRAGSR